MGTSAKYTCADGVTAWKYCSRKLSVLCRGDIGRRETSTRRKKVENVKMKLVSEGRSTGGQSVVLGQGSVCAAEGRRFPFPFSAYSNKADAGLCPSVPTPSTNAGTFRQTAAHSGRMMTISVFVPVQLFRKRRKLRKGEPRLS